MLGICKAEKRKAKQHHLWRYISHSPGMGNTHALVVVLAGAVEDLVCLEDTWALEDGVTVLEGTTELVVEGTAEVLSAISEVDVGQRDFVTVTTTGKGTRSVTVTVS